jgi:hypothetical protein
MAVEVSDAEMQQDEARSWDLHEEDAGFVADLPVEPEPEALDAPGAGREEAAPIDESGSLFICREFTLEAFAAWFAVQELGTKPYNGIGVHHTYRPTGRQFFGAATTRAIFDYYTREFGWKFGKGPHLWLYGGDNPDYKPGQTLVVVGTHPAHDGIGITGRNHRWVHIECYGDFDAGRMPAGCVSGYRFLLRILSERRGQTLRINHGPSVTGPATWQGALFHRDAGTDVKSCPGTTTTHAWFDAAVLEDEEEDLPTTAQLLTKPRIGIDRVEQYLTSFDTGAYDDADVRRIVAYYFATARPAGLDPLLVVAQMALETGHLSSSWSQVPRRNPAGIGVTGEPGVGLSFPDWITAVRAHTGRLLAYALPAGTGTPAQRALVDEALAHRPLPAALRGSAPTLDRLAGRWATDPAYASKVAGLASRMLDSSPT